MSWQMEHRFLYERLRKPRTDTERFMRGIIDSTELARSSVDTFAAEGQAGMEIYFNGSCFDKAFKKWQVQPHLLQAVHAQGGLFDPSLQNLAHLGSLFLERGSVNYVFAKDFWSLLQKTTFTDFRWSNLPKSICCSMRFPEPVVDAEGDPISEMNFVVATKEEMIRLRHGYPYSENQERGGDHVLLAWWNFDHSDQVTGFVHQIFGHDDDRIADSWNRRSVDSPGMLRATNDNLVVSEADIPGFAFAAIKALVYVHTGSPDLSELKNPIQYREKDKSRPIGEHKQYSELPFRVVGFSWLKEREHHTDSWPVEPFMRWQRVGPGRQDLKLTMVREHTRSWKP